MKIENIIHDIMEDMQELKSLSEKTLKKQYPCLDISIVLPGIEELSAIKVMELTIKESDKSFFYSVEVHTHNGHRVFEKVTKEVQENDHIEDNLPHPSYEKFIATLREIIKKKKLHPGVKLSTEV